MSGARKEDGSTKSFVEYKAERTTADTRVEQIASAGASAAGGAILELNENQKRWIVTGICLNKVVTPQLRKYIEPHMKNTYIKLEKSNNIDRQTYPTHLKTDGKNKLNYAAINNNQTMHGHTTRLYDYKVTSHVDMAKLYLQTHMAKFNAFDESCDPSAVLGILCAASCFSPTIQTNAQDVRANVRNEWAHCNFADWNGTKFEDAFQQMEVLVRSFLPKNADTDDIVDQLNDWKNKGVLLCMGSSVDKNLLQVLYQEVSVLAEYSLDIQEETRNQLQEICSKLNSTLQQFERRLEATEKEIKKNSDTFVTLANEHGALQEEQSTTNRKLVNLEEEHGCTREDVKRMKLDQTYAEDKLQRLETKQTEASTEMPKLRSQQNVLDMKQSSLEAQVELVEGRVQLIDDKLKDTNSSTTSQACFQVPNRNEYFSGREHELGKIEEAFAISKSSTACNKVLGINGLGGCGKTTLAVEYSWRSSSYYKGGVFWISAENESFFRNTVMELAFELKTFHDDFDKCFRATLFFLSRLQFPFLLVVDNADELELSNNVLKLLRGHWMRESKGHILVTTRRKAEELQEVVDITHDYCVTLGCYTQDEAVTFMHKRTNMTMHAASDGDASLETEDLDPVTELVDELGGLPLALEQAGSHIKALNCTYPQYLGQFKKQKMKLIQQMKARASSEEISKERLAVHTTWLMNFEYASQLAKDSGLEELTSVFIDVSAYLSPDDIPCDLVNQAYSLSKPQHKTQIETHSVDVEGIISILTKFSLFQSTSRDSLSVHRLVQQVIQSRLSEERSAEVLQYGIQMLDFAFRNTNSPSACLAENSGRTTLDDAYVQGDHFLLTWARLASNAVTFKSHLMDYVSSHLQAGSRLLYTEGTAKIVWETAIYLSMSNQQPQAFESQTLMLQILADIGNSGLLTNQVSIPLTDNQRRVLRLCAKPREKPLTIFDTPVGESTKQEVVDRLRQEGKTAYEMKDYLKAVSIYTEAIKVGEMHVCKPNDLSKLYCNRSQCYLKLNRPTDALHDSEECIKMDPHSCKGYYRRAKAMKLLFKKGKVEYKLAYLASAAMAVYLDPDAIKEAEREFGSDIRNARIVSTQDQWMGVISEIRRPTSICSSQRQTGLIILLKSGKYIFDAAFIREPMFIREHTIFIGVGDVEIENAYVTIGPECNCHLENIAFDNTIFVAMKSFLSCVGCTFQNGPVGTFSECLTESCVGCRICQPKAYVREGDVLGGTGSLLAEAGSNLFVIRCTLRDSAGGILATDSGTSALVRNCKIHDHYQASVEARYGASVVVEQSELFNSKHAEGVCLGRNAGPSRVTNNIIFGNESWGVVVGQGSYEITIEGNKIYQNRKDGIKLMDSASMVARKNEIFENNFWGIDVDYGTSDEISENIIHDNRCGGIRVTSAEKVVLVRNEVTDHNGPGILHSHRTMADILLGHLLNLTPAPPEMFQNTEMRNEEGKQHPQEKPVSVGLRCAQCSLVQSDKIKLLHCSGCRKASYCNKKCQREHWKRHKALCQALKDNFSHVIDIPPTGLTSQRNFHPDLKGIKQAPKPDRNSTKRFIIKIQTLEDLINRYRALTLYDQSTDVEVDELDNEIIHNIIVQCGVLGCSKATGKKIFCYASFENKGKKLRIYLDELAPFQEW